MQLLFEYGFEVYRLSRNTSKVGSLKQLIVPPVTDYPTATGQLASIPETMFLAARRPLWYRKWTVSRAIEQAATDGGLVHLWWHPHNVISQPAMLDLIEEIVARVHGFCESDDLRCVPMSGLTE